MDIALEPAHLEGPQMSFNTFGQLFRFTTWGESHGPALGVVVDGCPPGIPISAEIIQRDLDRRKPGQSRFTTQRREEDLVKILSGTFEDERDGILKTTGTPISLLIENTDQRSKDYSEIKNKYRPGHADFTYQTKYGIRDYKGSGRASARETLARVAAGAIAKKYLKEKLGIEFLSYVEQVGDIKTTIDFEEVTHNEIESNIVRCPDQKIAEKMIKLIEEVRDDGDSIGGIIRGVIKHIPVGLGEPVFDKLSADLAKAMMSINATKGFAFGSGFDGVKLRGSQHNDSFYIDSNGNVKTKTNNAGGTLGGISNGETLHFRVAFKPVSTIKKKQQTVTSDKKQTELE